MTGRPRIVVDNNVLVSRLLIPSSIPAKAVRKAVESAQPLTSCSMVEELAAVLSRPRFDRYVTLAERQDFLRYWLRLAEVVPILHRIVACRDPKDNHILETAVSGSAEIVISGDDDLVALNPYHSIQILRPAEYLNA